MQYLSNEALFYIMALSVLSSQQLGCAVQADEPLSNAPRAEADAASEQSLDSSNATLPTYVREQLPSNATVVSHDTFEERDGSETTKVAYLLDGQLVTEQVQRKATSTSVRPRRKGVLSEGLVSALASIDEATALDLDIYARDDGEDPPPRRAVALSAVALGGRVTHIAVDGAPAAERDLSALQEELRAEIAERDQARIQRRNARLHEVAGRLGAPDTKWSNGSLRLRANKREVARLVDLCGDLCSSIEPHRDPGTGTTLTQVNTSMGTTSWAFPYGYTGTGVGVWVRDEGKPDLAAQYTNAAGQRVNLLNSSRITILDSALTTAVHTTQVAASFQSAAPNAQLYVGDGNSCLIRDNLSTLTNPRVYLTSHSWSWLDSDNGSYGECARQWDNFVYNNRITTFFLAHNQGNYVTTPGRGYNVIAVGAYDSANNTIWSSSNYRNPETGAEKPEIAAPGVGIDIGDWRGVSGTSIATPLAAGFAADLVSGNINLFGYHPELVKAYLMAGATTNVEGDRRISDRDGAGAIWYGDTQFDNGWGYWNGGNGSFFDANGNIDTSWSLTGGQRYRIAIAWLVPGDYTLANKAPSQDIDLQILLNGAYVTSSSSASNSFELVDFAPAQTGTHTIRIRRYRNSGGNVILGLSVSKI